MVPGTPGRPLAADGGADGRLRAGAAAEERGGAEITPLRVDADVTWDAVGGLDHYVKVLPSHGQGGGEGRGQQDEGRDRAVGIGARG